MTKFCSDKTCDECPFRRDVKPGQFPPERFVELAGTAGPHDAFKPIFACHKSPAGEEFACVGYVIVEGDKNLSVRLAQVLGRIPTLTATGPLYESYELMAAANGATELDYEANNHPIQQMLDELRASV